MIDFLVPHQSSVKAEYIIRVDENDVISLVDASMVIRTNGNELLL
jgi:hypothetical protein